MNTKKIVFSIFKTCLSIAIIMFLVMTLIQLSGKAYDFGRRIFSEEPMTPAPGYSTSVAIVEGKSVKEIGKILEEKGLIRDATLFYFQEMVSDYHDKLMPGVYQLSTAMTPEEMMAIMAESYVEPGEEKPEDAMAEEDKSSEDEEESVYGGEYSEEDIEFNTEGNTDFGEDEESDGNNEGAED